MIRARITVFHQVAGGIEHFTQRFAGLLFRHFADSLIGFFADRDGIGRVFQFGVKLFNQGMSLRVHGFLIMLNGIDGFGVVRVAQRTNQTVVPVEIIRGDSSSCVSNVVRCGFYISVERNDRVKDIAAIAQPVDRPVLFGDVGPDLHNVNKTGPVNPDGAIGAAPGIVTQFRVGVIRGSLIMG